MELDAVTQPFEADVSNFVNNIELAIEASRHFRDEVLADVEEIRAAIDSLPEERVVHVRVDYDQSSAGPAFTGPAGPEPDLEVFRSFDDILGEYEAMQARAATATEASAAATHDLADADITAAEVERLLASATEARRDADLSAAVAADILAASTAKAAAAGGGGGGGGGWGGGFWGFLGRDIPMMAGLLPAIRGWHIALDAVVESAFALGTALVALSAGIAAMVPAANDIYTHMSSVRDVNAALKDQIPVLGGDFRNFAESAGNASHVLEAYGGLINAVSGQTGAFAGVAKEVVMGIDDWIARLDLFMAHQHSTGKLLQDGVGFLSQFRQAVDNVAVALDHLLAADPGTAHYLMDIVVGATKVLDVITMLPAPVLEAALALHSFWLWGGLMGTGIGNLLGQLRAMALGMGDVAAENIALTASTEKAGGFAALKATVADIGAGFASWGGGIKTAVTEAEGMSKVGAGLGSVFSFVNPVALGVTALAAGIGFLTYEMLQSSEASQKFGASVNQALNQSSATQFLAQVPQLQAQGSAGLASALKQQTDAWKSYNIATHNTVEDLKNADFPGLFENGAKAVGDFFTAAVHGRQAQNSIQNYTGALANLDAGQKRILQDADGLISKGNSLAQSFALLDLAGVSASDSLALAGQKVKNLITGYEAMSVQGNLLSGAVNAVTFASEQQQSKVQALTQAYSTWFSTITGGVSTFATFATQAIGLYGALSSGAATLSSRNGQVAVSMQGLAAQSGDTTVSMTGLNAASLNAQQTFIQSASAAQNQYNSLLTLASAAGLGSRGTGMLTGAMKDYMAILMPAAGSNKALQQSLVSMYQEINPNVTSFGQLQSVVGNVKNPMQNLQNTTAAFTTAAGNLTTDVNNLAQAIGQNLNQAMAQAILQANGGQGAFDKFATAALNAHGNTKQMYDAAEVLAAKLIQVTGNTKTAEGEFVTFATELGIGKSAAQQLWNSVESGAATADTAVQQHTNNIIGDLARIPTNVPVTVRMTYMTGNVPSIPGVSAPGHAAGWHVPGYGGGDTVPAMLEPGEAVVPKHLVPAVAPFLGAHHVPGFAAGGKVGHPWDMADVFALWGKEMWAHDLHGHGRGHPIAQAAMEALLASVTQPKKLSGIWDNPLWRDYARDLKADMGPYAAKDLEFWKLMGERKSLSASEKTAIAHDLHEEHLHALKHQPGWVQYYEKKADALEAADAKTLAGYARTLASLERQGFAAGGLVRSYDSGGYLPVGLSMAYNGTGKPEAVGGSGGKPEVHVHLHGDLADDTIWDRMQAKTLDYGYANTGRPTGVWQPGG